MLEKFDSNGDGKIDQNELKQLLLWMKKGMAVGILNGDDRDSMGTIPSEIGMIR